VGVPLAPLGSLSLRARPFGLVAALPLGLSARSGGTALRRTFQFCLARRRWLIAIRQYWLRSFRLLVLVLSPAYSFSLLRISLNFFLFVFGKGPITSNCDLLNLDSFDIARYCGITFSSILIFPLPAQCLLLPRFLIPVTLSGFNVTVA